MYFIFYFYFKKWYPNIEKVEAVDKTSMTTSSTIGKRYKVKNTKILYLGLFSFFFKDI